MAIKLTLTVKPRRRSLRIAARRQQARHQPYPQRQSAGSQPTPPSQPRASSPVIKQESRASSPIVKQESRSRTPSPVIKREESSSPPLNIIPFTPINKREQPKLKNSSFSSSSSSSSYSSHHWEIPLHSIPQYFPALGPNTGDGRVDPRYVPGNFILDERGVERRVLGRGEVATLTTMQCWENGDLF